MNFSEMGVRNVLATIGERVWFIVYLTIIDFGLVLESREVCLRFFFKTRGIVCDEKPREGLFSVQTATKVPFVNNCITLILHFTLRNDFIKDGNINIRKVMLIQDKKTSVNHHESFLSRLTGNFAYGLPFSARRGVTRTEDSRVRPRQANLTVTQGQGQIPIAILHLDGPLNASCYLDLIAKAKEIYGTGTRYIVLDMSDIPSVGSSGILALHSIAVVLRGEEPLDPQGGWGSLRAMANELETGSLGKQFKLFNPKPQVREALEQAGFVGFLEIHTDLDTAITSFQAGRRH